MHHPSHLIALLVVISGCDEPTDREAVSGGVVYYSRYDFTGGALPLAVGGFGNYHEVGPSLGFAPPYSAVVSTGFFGTGAAAEVHAMQGGVPVPDVVDTCRTTTDFSDGEGLVPVDAGDSLTVLFPETDAAIMLQRYPVIYEGGQEDTDVYYFGASAWRPEPVHTRVPGASDDPLAMDRSVLVSENFSHGELATLGFPGGLAPEGAGVASIPMPSTSVGSSEFYLPNEVEGVRLAWTGPRFDADGEIIGEGEQATCLRYSSPEGSAAPSSPEDCTATDSSFEGQAGQIYTGPWHSEDGQVTFQWEVPTNPVEGEFITLSVRFLEEVDRDDHERFGAWMVSYSHDDPRCGREAMACEEGDWVFDPGYLDLDWLDPRDATCGDGSYPLDQAPLIPAMQGDPTRRVAEVKCWIEDDGEFVLSRAHLGEAMVQQGGQGVGGVLFLLARNSVVTSPLPDIRSASGERISGGQVTVRVADIDVGRFHWDASGADRSVEE